MSGIFGVVSKDNCLQDLFYGADYHSHLGTEYGGIAVLSGDEFIRQIHKISQTQFKSKFFEDYQHVKGNKGIAVISDADAQPIYLKSKFGPFCIVTSGLIENKEELAQDLLRAGGSLSEVNDDGSVNAAELIAKLISQGDDIIDGIEKMFDKIKGSCSLLLLHKDGLYAARDRWGYTPLILGKRNEDWCVTAETNALMNLGFSAEKFLLPGEIILINEEGLAQRKPGCSENCQICTFLWIYTGFPASSYEGINTEVVRERCGRALAPSHK